jgi:enamine deaminase RidA (YjgF/YER057c/UK114 family)
MAAQIRQALANLETVLERAGFKLADVVRLNYYTTDVDRFMTDAGAGLGRLVETGCRPASTLLGVARLFHRDILVEIEATAMV